MTPEIFAVLFAVLFKAVLWGIGENRQFHDTDWGTQGSGVMHLSTYHIWMFLFFAVLNGGFAAALSGTWYTQMLLFTYFTIWDILILDVSWWIIRYVDITHIGKSWGLWVTWNNEYTYVPIHIFPKSNPYDHGEGKPWHSLSDWDSAGLPLWLGTYSWWWLLSGILAVLGTVVLVT